MGTIHGIGSFEGLRDLLLRRAPQGPSLTAFPAALVRLWRITLRRRSQNGFVSWARMRRLKARWLPGPRICWWRSHEDDIDVQARGRSERLEVGRIGGQDGIAVCCEEDECRINRVGRACASEEHTCSPPQGIVDPRCGAPAATAPDASDGQTRRAIPVPRRRHG